MARFDWYQATVEEPPLWLRGALDEALNGLGRWVDTKPRQGYARAEQLYSPDGDELLELLSGGAHEWPHVVATSAPADEAARLLRAVAPRHLVARGDVCEDIDKEGWFETAHACLLDVAKEKRVKPSVAGDWFGSTGEGRTSYLGSPTSAVRVRLYEKGREVISKHPAAAADVSQAWARLEIQVRPAKRDAKLQMAMVPASDWWGCSSYSRVVAERLLDESAPRLKVGTVWRASELEKAGLHMLRQYHRVFEEMHSRLGSWEAVGSWIGEELQKPYIGARPDLANEERSQRIPNPERIQHWLREIDGHGLN